MFLHWANKLFLRGWKKNPKSERIFVGNVIQSDLGQAKVIKWGLKHRKCWVVLAISAGSLGCDSTGLREPGVPRTCISLCWLPNVICQPALAVPWIPGSQSLHCTSCVLERVFWRKTKKTSEAEFCHYILLCLSVWEAPAAGKADRDEPGGNWAPRIQIHQGGWALLQTKCLLILMKVEG